MRNWSQTAKRSIAHNQKPNMTFMLRPLKVRCTILFYNTHLGYFCMIWKIK